MSMVTQDPTQYAHIVSMSPIAVDLEGGRQGLANPAWCGWVGPRIRVRPLFRLPRASTATSPTAAPPQAHK